MWQDVALADETCPARQNVAWLMGRGLADGTRLPDGTSLGWRDVAWAGPTTTATRVQETRRSHTQMTLRFPRKGLEGPTDGISIEEKPVDHPSRSNGSSGYREIGKEQWDAPCGLRRFCHERWTRIPFGHIR